MTELSPKKVFISYSWSTPDHEDWVLSLAHQLMSDGIEVVLDKWDLKEGQDKYHFMESMVNASDIDKVLVICDKKYLEKANNRAGGVGTETQIITSQVYNLVKQEKFIPIVAELDESGQPYLPSYLANRIYINLSSEANYASGYEALIRNIFNRPTLSKPKLGTPPSYLLENSPITYKTTSMLRGMDAQLDKHPTRINLIMKDFLAEFDNNLLDFKIENAGITYIEIGSQIIYKLGQYIPLRDDYIHFIDKLTKYDHGFDTDILIRFFEDLPLHLHTRTDNHNGIVSTYHEHFKFINHELFVYTIAIALRNDNYRILEDLLLSKYFFKSAVREVGVPLDYDHLRNNLNAIDQFHQQLMGRRSDNAHMEVLMSRIPDFIRNDDFIAGDLFCYHIGMLNNVDWFPITYGYNSRGRGDFEFFNRLISLKHFNKVKRLLGVETVEQFKSKLNDLITKGQEQGYANFRGRVPAVFNYIQPDKVATLP